MSQLDLATEAGVSTRHLSFVETGRSVPSRDMVLLLADVLDVPLRERNALLQAAGFAPRYQETDLGSPELAQVRRALDFILDRHEPYGAYVIDRHYNIKMMNEAMKRSMVWALGREPDGDDLNALHTLFDPDGIRPCVDNWDEVAPMLLHRLQRQAAVDRDDVATRLVAELLVYPGVPAEWHDLGPAGAPQLLIPLVLAKDGIRLNLFSTITTLGTAQDITLNELRIETFFPGDEDTDRFLRMLGGATTLS